MKPVSKATKTVTWAAACCTLVAAWEGCDFTAKKDMIGTGHPLTWCHGETIGSARPGQKFTRAECDALLETRLPTYWAQIESSIHVPTTDHEKIAYTSTTYNIGSGAFRKSSMVRKLNQGDHKGACDALMLYNRAGGKVVKGLTNRRRAERKMCLTPDEAPGTSTLPTIASKPQAQPAPRVFSYDWWMAA